MVTWPFAFFAFDLTFKSKQKQTVMSACKKKANESKISTKSTSLDLGKSEGFEAESVWTGCGGRYDEKKRLCTGLVSSRSYGALPHLLLQPQRR